MPVGRYLEGQGGRWPVLVGRYLQGQGGEQVASAGERYLQGQGSAGGEVPAGPGGAGGQCRWGGTWRPGQGAGGSGSQARKECLAWWKGTSSFFYSRNTAITDTWYAGLLYCEAGPAPTLPGEEGLGCRGREVRRRDCDVGEGK